MFERSLLNAARYEVPYYFFTNKKKHHMNIQRHCYLDLLFNINLRNILCISKSQIFGRKVLVMVVMMVRGRRCNNALAG